MTEFTLAALNAEISNDPEGLGYGIGTIPYDPATEWKSDQAIADLIDAKNFNIDRISVKMEVLRAITEEAWYNGLAADKQEWLRWQTPDNGNWNVSADMKLQLSGRALTVNGVAGTGNNNASFWVGGDRAVAAPAMLALIEVLGSRAEVLWGERNIISLGQIGAASNLP